MKFVHLERGPSVQPVPSPSPGALGRCPTDGLGPLPAIGSDILSAATGVKEAPATTTVLASREPGSGLLVEQRSPYGSALTTRGQLLR